MNKKLNNFVRRYLVSAMILLVVLSTIGVNLVFAKYTSNKDDVVNITVNSYSGNISVALRDGETATDFAPHKLKLLPGNTYSYDPYVYIDNDSPDRSCYLFVKIEEIGGKVTASGRTYYFDDFIDYTIEAGWTRGDGEKIPSDVYYRQVGADTSAYYRLFKNDTVTIKQSAPELGFIRFLTKDTPTFGINLYAVEITKLEATDTVSAWNWIMKQQVTDSESDGNEGGEGGSEPEPTYNFNGANYNIFARGERHEGLWATDSPNNNIEQAASDRNNAIEAKYNVNIRNVGTDGEGNFRAMLENNAMVGDDTVDLMVPDYFFYFQHKGYLRNLRDLPELDFDADYWVDSWNDALTYNGRMYMCVGKATPDLNENIMVAFFNTQTVKERGISLYDMVRNGTWTLDEMHTLAKQFVVDHANDNASIALASIKAHSFSTSADKTTTTAYLFRHYNGFDMTNEAVQALLFASGIRLSEKDEDGTLRLIADSHTVNYDYYESARDLVSDHLEDYKVTLTGAVSSANLASALTNEVADVMRKDTSAGRYVRPATERSQEEERTLAIVDGRTLFSVRWLGAGGQFNAKKFTNYGFVPLPKHSEKSDYVSIQYGISPFAIPVASRDPVKSAVILNAMNRESETYDMALWNYASPNGNISANNDLLDMMKIIRGSFYADFDKIMYAYPGMDVYEAFNSCVSDNTKNINYELGKALKTYDLAIAEIMQIYYGAGVSTASE